MLCILHFTVQKYEAFWMWLYRKILRISSWEERNTNEAVANEHYYKKEIEISIMRNDNYKFLKSMLGNRGSRRKKTQEI